MASRRRSTAVLLAAAVALIALVAAVSAYEDEEPWSERGRGGGGRGRGREDPWSERGRGGRGEGGDEPWSERGRGGRGEGGSGRREGSEGFLLQDSKAVVTTDAGSMRMVRGFGGKLVRNPMHIGFITMEPHSIFIPQYLDSSIILFVRRGTNSVSLILSVLKFVAPSLLYGDRSMSEFLLQGKQEWGIYTKMSWWRGR